MNMVLRFTQKRTEEGSANIYFTINCFLISSQKLVPQRGLGPCLWFCSLVKHMAFNTTGISGTIRSSKMHIDELAGSPSMSNNCCRFFSWISENYKDKLSFRKWSAHKETSSNDNTLYKVVPLSTHPQHTGLDKNHKRIHDSKSKS